MYILKNNNKKKKMKKMIKKLKGKVKKISKLGMLSANFFLLIIKARKLKFGTRPTYILIPNFNLLFQNVQEPILIS